MHHRTAVLRRARIPREDKLFARLSDEPGVLVLWRGSVEDRDALVAADPDKFFTTDHYARQPLVLLRLSAVDEPELAELLTEAWETRASARLRTAGGQQASAERGTVDLADEQG